MTTSEEITEVIRILTEVNGGPFDMGAEHDVVYFWPERDRVSDDQEAELNELGAFWDEGIEVWCLFV